MTSSSQAEHHGQGQRAPISQVVLVGHCGFDQASIGRAVVSALSGNPGESGESGEPGGPREPGVAVESVCDSAGLDVHGGPDALLLINRVLDGRFGTGSGVDLIEELSARESPPLMMLISNYPDAQAQAVKAGALPGFGKNELGSPQTVRKLQDAVQAKAP